VNPAFGRRHYLKENAVLYYLLYPLADAWKVLNVFRYITFRSIYAAITAFLICLVLGPMLIKVLKKKGVEQAIRTDGPGAHLKKAGTPTMGGLIILPAILLSAGLWARWEQPTVAIAVMALLWFGGVGFWDDFIKFSGKNPKGMSSRLKLALQAVGGVAVMAAVLYLGDGWALATSITVPFFKSSLHLPVWLYFTLGWTVIVGSSNGVNFTDGLDGLASGALALVGLTLALMSYLVANAKFAGYLLIIHVAGCGELTVICSALVGAVLGFLWFNSHPAEIFMGDTGSLALGGMLGTVAVLIKQEVLLFVVGGLFVAETLSVILQVTSFKLTGKRIFRMAPLHHHFELLGWSETKVIIRFWIVAILLAVLALSTLKLR
jgi:phospho-N-acetylmuramoyl-pentapeptide-transferase